MQTGGRQNDAKQVAGLESDRHAPTNGAIVGTCQQLTVRPQAIAAVVIAAATLTLTACAGGSGGTGALKLPSLPSLDPNSLEAPAANDGPVGTPTEVYARVARGALGCWFAPEGGMKKDYIYHADAEAPSRGGSAVIVLHRRDPSQPNPRGAKYYRIRIAKDPSSSATSVKTENLKMSEALAAGLDADVRRWAHGEQGCAAQSTAAGWSASDEAASKTTKPSDKARKTKKK